jgi:ABC-type methionine transport system ATPase subunit
LIAGNRGIGVGTFIMLGKLEKPNDGTVAVSETDVSLLKEHLQAPYSHFGILLARPVAQAVASFLRHGRFDRKY